MMFSTVRRERRHRDAYATTGDTMTVKEAQSLIDYFVNHPSAPWYTNPAIWISIIALLVSILGASFTYRSLQDADRRHIRTEWNGILDICIKYPQFIDISFVRDYNCQDREICLVYDAFCYKVWSLVEFIAKRKLKTESQYSMIVHWIAAYHKRWLYFNQSRFTSNEFWDIYESARAEPVQFRTRMLPITASKPARQDGDLYTDAVDWDRVHENYSNWVISPLAPEMVKLDSQNQRRNVLVTQLLATPDLKTKRILDVGCGPGNLLEVFAGQDVGAIYGLDISEKALAIASEKAQKLGVSFVPIKADMRDFVARDKFDIIISINSILPTKRDDVALMLRQIHNNLADSGRFLAILPSFDTCQALADYWKTACQNRSKDMDLAKKIAYRANCAAAFKEAKKMNEATLSFADDGVHVQSFHNRTSIGTEFPAAGLKVVGDPIKVNYPWEYAEKFDYGYFPDQPEIWDWFVEAEKDSSP